MADDLDWGWMEMAKDGDGDAPLLDTGTAPTIFSSGADIELADGLAHLIFWEPIHGTHRAPERRVAARIPMPADAARALGALLRKKLPGRSSN